MNNNKQFISTGHCKISPNLLEEVLRDSPRCSGRTEYILCTFSRAECHKQCYASESLGCSIYRLLSQSKSVYDRMGVCKR